MKKEYWINVKHVDNRLVIFLNGATVWDSGIVHGDPEMDAYINITEHLVAHINHSSELIFEGFNDNYHANGFPFRYAGFKFSYLLDEYFYC